MQIITRPYAELGAISLAEVPCAQTFYVEFDIENSVENPPLWFKTAKCSGESGIVVVQMATGSVWTFRSETMVVMTPHVVCAVTNV